MKVWMVEVEDRSEINSLWFTRDLAYTRALKIANTTSLPSGYSNKTVVDNNNGLIQVNAQSDKRDAAGAPFRRSLRSIWITEEVIQGDIVSRLAAVTE